MSKSNSQVQVSGTVEVSSSAVFQSAGPRASKRRASAIYIRRPVGLGASVDPEQAIVSAKGTFYPNDAVVWISVADFHPHGFGHTVRQLNRAVVVGSVTKARILSKISSPQIDFSQIGTPRIDLESTLQHGHLADYRLAKQIQPRVRAKYIEAMATLSAAITANANKQLQHPNAWFPRPYALLKMPMLDIFDAATIDKHDRRQFSAAFCERFSSAVADGLQFELPCSGKARYVACEKFTSKSGLDLHVHKFTAENGEHFWLTLPWFIRPRYAVGQTIPSLAVWAAGNVQDTQSINRFKKLSPQARWHHLNDLIPDEYIELTQAAWFESQLRLTADGVMTPLDLVAMDSQSGKTPVKWPDTAASIFWNFGNMAEQGLYDDRLETYMFPPALFPASHMRLALCNRGVDLNCSIGATDALYFKNPAQVMPATADEASDITLAAAV